MNTKHNLCTMLVKYDDHYYVHTKSLHKTSVFLFRRSDTKALAASILKRGAPSDMVRFAEYNFSDHITKELIDKPNFFFGLMIDEEYGKTLWESALTIEAILDGEQL